MPRRALRRAASIAVLYLAAIAVYVYAVLDPAVTFADDVASGVVLAALAALNLATGWLAAGWWALALPAAAVPLGIPAGYAERYEDVLVWKSLAYAIAPPATCLVALGVGARRLGPRRRAA